MPELNRPLRVFLCHASGDKPVVRELYKRLVAEGIDTWLDEEKLLPGQDWQIEIPDAVRNADIVLVCLTCKAINKAGYVQKEMKFALDVAQEQPEGAIYLIPVKLEDCDVPKSFVKYQWAILSWDGKSFDEVGFQKLMRSLQLRAEKIGAAIQPVKKTGILKKLTMPGPKPKAVVNTKKPVIQPIISNPSEKQKPPVILAPKPENAHPNRRTLNPTVITAVIGAFATIFAAVLGFPPLIQRLEQTPAPTLTITSTSTLPTAVTATMTSTLRPSLTPPPSLTPLPTNTASQVPTLTPNPTSTFTPTIEPKVFRGIDKNCIDKKYWYPKPVYSSDKTTLDVNNCWNVSSWGIFTENQTLRFSIQDALFNDRITRSIYTQISSKVTAIQFKVKVDVLTSSSDMDGVLFIGLGNEGNFTKPGLFVKLVAPAKLNRVFLETGPQYMTYWDPKLDYTLGDVLPIKIVINGDYVSIRVNGAEIQGTNLIATNREVLWIGYNSPPTNNNLSADIFDFAIYEK